jgi:hypothetical protein
MEVNVGVAEKSSDRARRTGPKALKNQKNSIMKYIYICVCDIKCVKKFGKIIKHFESLYSEGERRV